MGTGNVTLTVGSPDLGCCNKPFGQIGELSASVVADLVNMSRKSEIITVIALWSNL